MKISPKIALFSILLNIILIVSIGINTIIDYNDQQDRSNLLEKARQKVNEAHLATEQKKSETEIDRIKNRVEYHQFIVKELYDEYGINELEEIMELIDIRLDSIANVQK